MERRMFLLVLVFVFARATSLAEAITLGNETDRLALLDFRSRITRDPSGVLSSWNDTTHFCDWVGISCNRNNPQRVTVLNLGHRDLEGSISPSIGNLSFLQRALLMDNGFTGEIPEEFSHLQQLRLLNLSYNVLHGAIPANLSACSELITLHLVANQLTGGIPSQLGFMPKLKALALDNNNLTGAIPPSLGNLSSLVEFSAMLNFLEESIPEGLGKLVNLSFFQVAGNMLSGTIPPQLFNLSSMYYFSAAGNQLHGSLPPTMGLTLPSIQVLYLGANHFLSGSIPPSLPNATTLEEFDIPENNFSGRIPSDLGRLKNLIHFNVVTNRLEANNPEEWKFLDSLTNCTRLIRLFIGANDLRGPLPSSIANLSMSLQGLRLGYSQITGSLPSGIGKYVNLNLLDSTNSFLIGAIPDSIGNLKSLLWLDFSANKLRGRIPSSLGNLTQLSDLYLSNNYLEGPIPLSFGDLRQLTSLDLSNNSLHGSIPKELLSLPSITKIMDLSSNSLDGPLPLEVGSLKNLKQLYFSRNKLSGEIPGTLGNCEILEDLALDNNFFHGSIPDSLSNMKGIKGLDLSHNTLSGNIPPSFSNMKGLQELDLSNNNLSGSIPEFLEDLSSLFHLNLSHNHLEGEVPTKGVFGNDTAISLLGNEGLCGGIPVLHLAACPTTSSKRRNWSLVLKIVIPIAVVAIFLLLFISFVLFYWKKELWKRTLNMQHVDDLHQHRRVSYSELAQATDGFSSTNVIGTGRYGTVYKGTLVSDGTIVAVKVFNLEQRGASKSFVAECEALRSIRHRNLVKILTSCSSVDFKGNDFKALVFDFMPNGNLEKWLHPSSEQDQNHQTNHLSLLQRLNIAIDVANSLNYLHNSCDPPVVHCDLKPSNVLLDNDMSAHVGDFGLAKMLSEAMGKSPQDSVSSIGIRGTVGYVAPEYGAGCQVSASGDVYSYGILLLEMFTGKRPTDEMFRDGSNLREFVEMGASPERVMEIADPQVLLEIEDHITNGMQNGKHAPRKILESLVSVFHLGFLCSNPSPRGRQNMEDVAAQMHAIRDAYLGVGVHGERGD